MQKLVFTNGGGNTIDLTSGNFGITNWEGLSGVGLNIQTQQVPFQDGGVFLDALMEQREISVTVAIQDNNDLSLRYELKRQLISALNPKLGEGVLVYTNDYLSRQIKAVPQLPIFENKNSNDAGTLKASVVFSCPSPYWEDLEDTVVIINNGLEATLQNNGDISTNPNIEIITSNVDNPMISNLINEKKIKIEGHFNSNIQICTEVGEKRIILEDFKTTVINSSDVKDYILYGGNIITIGDEIQIISADGKVVSIGNPTGYTLQRIKQINNFIYVVGSGGTILRSSDGYNWENYSLNAPQTTIYDIEFANGMYSICGATGYVPALIGKSTDGKTFVITSGYNEWQSLRTVLVKDNTFYYMRSSSAVTSTDAENFTSVSLVNYNGGKPIKTSNGIYIVVGNNGSIKKSSDIINWEDVASGTEEDLLYINETESKYIITGKNGTILESEYLNSWNAIPFPSPDDITMFYCLYGNYVFFASNNVKYITRDFENWNKKEGMYDDINYIYNKGNQFLFLTGADNSTSQGNIAISQDFINYDLTQTEKTLVDMVVVNNRVYAVGWDGLVCIGNSEGVWETTYLGNRKITKILYNEDSQEFVLLSTTKIYKGENINNMSEITPSKSVNSFTYKDGLYYCIVNEDSLYKLCSTTNFNSFTLLYTFNPEHDTGVLYIRDVFIYNSNLYCVGGYYNLGSFLRGKIYKFSDFENPKITNVSGIDYKKGIIANGQLFLLAQKVYNSVLMISFSLSNDGEYYNNYKISDKEINTISYKDGLYYFGCKGSELIKAEYVERENIINKLSTDSDIGFNIIAGQNILKFISESGNAVCKISYRQKYLGV